MNIFFNRLLRLLIKSKVNLAINVLGLTVGMVAFLFIVFWIRSEKSYDRFWRDSGQVYRVALERISNGSEVFSSAMNYFGTASVLNNELAEIEVATNLDKDIITVFTPEASVQNVAMFFTDSLFFKVFPIEMECENRSLLFNDIHTAAISRSLAKKLFGEKDPLNRPFRLNEGWEFNVTAVFDDLPQNSHLKCDLILQRKALLYYMRNFNYSTAKLDNSNLGTFADRDPYSQSQWRSIRSYTYLRLKHGCSISQVEAKYAQAIAACTQHLKQDNQRVSFRFQPIATIHLDSDKNGEMFANGSRIRVVAFSIIGLLLLITTLLNYVNISVANTINNTAKQGIIRILGATRMNVLAEYITESFLINAASGIIAFAISALYLINGTTLFGFCIFPVSWSELLLVASLLILIGTISSTLYPYLFAMSRAKQNLKSLKSKQGWGVSSMRALVVFQFAASIFLIIGTIAIFRQMQFMQNKETGFDMEQTMVSFSPMTMIKKPDEAAKLQTFREEVRKIPGVAGFTTAEIVAGKNYDRYSNKISLMGHENEKAQYALANVDFDYFDFFAIERINGQLFTQTTARDGDEVIVNRKACEQLGIEPTQAVGHVIIDESRQYRIIGVIADYHHLSLKDQIEPVIYFNSHRWFRTVGHYFIKIAPLNRQETIKAINKLWVSVYPKEDYHFSFLDERFNQAYLADLNFGKVYLGLSLLTILVACMGLFALASFSSKTRVKEIGIRKVNGATIAEVLTMLNKDFVRWVTIAFIIATPVAYYVMDKWLENFAYKTEISWLIFALAGLLALGIALLTVSWQSWRAATRNPVEALRHE